LIQETQKGRADPGGDSPGTTHEPSVKQSFERLSFISLLVLVTLLFLYLLRPFFGPIFWACAIGVLFSPLYQRWLAILGHRPNLAALLTLAVCVVIAVVPTLFVVVSFFREGADLYQALESGEIDFGVYIDRIRQAFPALQDLLERLSIDTATLREQLSGAAIAASRYVAQHALQIGQGTVQFFLALGLMLYVAFFMLRDGPRLVRLLIRALPLGDDRERQLFSKFAEVTRATVKGNLVVAAVQGTLGGLIFWLLGIPAAFLCGVVMTLLSLIPLVGAGLIWAPVAVYLFAVGDWGQGLVLTVFGVGVIGVVDNILRPILVGRDTKLPDYIVLLSTLGGFVLFGINGFVIGPLIAALFVAFWEIFIRDFHTLETRLAGADVRGDTQ
jgi:predicted PurR-regulated permease PerM